LDDKTVDLNYHPSCIEDTQEIWLKSTSTYMGSILYLMAVC